MLTRIKRVLSNEAIMRRIVFTLALLLLLRIISHIPVPLIDLTVVKDFYRRGESFFAILNSFSGRSLQRFSILSLGITPYITGSIVVQLLVMVIPRIKEWSEEGENGKIKMNKVTRYLAVLIAFLQSLALILGANTGEGNIFANWYQGNYELGYIYMAICMTAGSTIAIWFADMITRRGVGNGSSILITASIIVSIPYVFTTLYDKYIVQNQSGVEYFYFVLIIIIYIAIILGIVFVETSKRNVPIQYSNRQASSNAKLPIKVNTPNVMPVIFASTILSIPLTVAGLLSTNGQGGPSNSQFWIQEVFSYNQPIGYIFYVLLIVIFSFFYAFLIVDPTKVAENLSKSNAYIQGVRPGEETRIKISELLFKVNVIGTFYLVLLASLPILTAAIFGFNTQETQAITIGGTSLLIVVGVGVETVRQIEADAGEEQYRGILG